MKKTKNKKESLPQKKRKQNKSTKPTTNLKPTKLVSLTNKSPQKKSVTTLKDVQPKNEVKEKNLFTRNAIINFLLIFLAIELLGLIVAINLFVQGNASPLFIENIDNILNGVHLFAMIIITTIIFLTITKFKQTKKFILGIEMIALATTSLIVFLALTHDNYYYALILTTLLFALRYSRIKNTPIRSIAAGIAIAGAGAYIGVSLGLIPLILFTTILALYDIFAVFYSKHMVTIGKESTQNNYAFTVSIPTKNKNFEIGNGDFVIPLMIASSTLIHGPFTNNLLLAGLILGASYLGLILSLVFVSKYKKPMPALPPQVLLMLIVILFGYLLLM